MRPSFHYMAKHFDGYELVTGVEIGVEHGYNALAILTEMGLLGVPVFLHLVEISSSAEADIRTTLRHVTNYELIIADSAAAAERFPEASVDFVYIDDEHSHEGVAKSLTAWYPKIRPNGIVAGHDYDVGHGSTEWNMVIDEFLDERGMRLFTEEMDWWGIKRK